MSIRIKDLPPKLRRIALQRCEEQNKPVDVEEEIIMAFTWDQTPEGDDFWNDIFATEEIPPEYQEKVQSIYY